MGAWERNKDHVNYLFLMTNTEFTVQCIVSGKTPVRWTFRRLEGTNTLCPYREPHAGDLCPFTVPHSRLALFMSLNCHISCWLVLGAGIAQWLEHRTRDWKVAGSNPCWNGGRIFFSRVDFLCWLLFRYQFHPRVTAVARKKSRSICQKCRWQVTAKHAYTLRMWILLNRASALVTTCP